VNRKPCLAHENRADHDAVTTAAHRRCRGLDDRHGRAQIQRAPAPAPITQIKARAASPTHAAAITFAPVEPDRHDQLSLIADLHVLDDRPLDAQQPRPYPGAAHVVPPPRGSSRQEAGTLGAARRAPFYRGLTDPPEQQERHNSQPEPASAWGPPEVIYDLCSDRVDGRDRVTVSEPIEDLSSRLAAQDHAALVQQRQMPRDILLRAAQLVGEDLDARRPIKCTAFDDPDPKRLREDRQSECTGGCVRA
jgi:hypothetical protein